MESYVSRTGIFHVLFTFIFIALTLIITVQSLIPNTNLHSLLPISPSYFISDLQERKNTVYWSLNATKEHTTDGLFTTCAMTENYRLSNCLARWQDQRPPPRLCQSHSTLQLPMCCWVSSCTNQSLLVTADRLFLGSQRTNRKHYYLTPR